MSPSDHLIRQDLETLPPQARRLARLSLQLFFSDSAFKDRLDDADFLLALWPLTQCLLQPAVLGQFDATLAVAEAELSRRSQLALRRLQRSQGQRKDDDEDESLLPSFMRSTPRRGKPRLQLLQQFYTHLSRDLLASLAAADGEETVAPTAKLLGRCLNLDATAVQVLDFLELRESNRDLRQLLNESRPGQQVISGLRADMAALLGLPEKTLRAALSKRAPLRALGLVEIGRSTRIDLEDYLTPSDLLVELVEAEPETEAGLLAKLIEPAPPAQWPLGAFPHLHTAAERVQRVLNHAARHSVLGVNALFYGAPGTGKSELARTLIAASGLSAYQVRSAGEDEEGLSRSGRLSAYLLAQRLLAKRKDAVLIFDEVEDVIIPRQDLFALLSGRPSGEQKGWMNRILEENPVPTIWITNQTQGMDPAFQRRFLLPLAFVTPPRSVRRQQAERHLGDLSLPPTLLDELAADEALMPAQLGAARRLVDLQPEAPIEPSVRAGVASLRQLLQGSPAPRRRASATVFDVAYLNLAGSIHPSALVQALEREGQGRLCFYGPPGTGKTEFAEVIAEALDRELVARQASDLISAYVGETEQNLAKLFSSLDPERSVLLLDEVDSFLADRRQAQRQWERTQVNELLQQMERYPGIFIAATNLMSGLDAAALRRFDFKLQFRALKPEQRLRLFAREALGDESAVVPERLARHLERLTTLTPGDVANVCRQQRLLGEQLEPEVFLRRLLAECQLKAGQGEPQAA
ncbi:AAA family ATPase [Lamprobacter modestohalophilus]|uniref:AAA family ATPase n=1 Tax=Lamprobacter modestohalophilus TaxID=1064514 RepID=A0A9X0WCQ0_9GAMM|nr:ATP-binding protein [Lamprobacter modestohalophilus]MBK1620750.1 AAA family ATPase [Lamprobacter modestohalophilus]